MYIDVLYTEVEYMAPKRQSPPLPLNNKTMKIGLIESVSDGVMIGAGSSLGRHAVNSILATSPSGSTTGSVSTNMNTSTILPEVREAECMKYIRQYEHCLGEIDTTCQEYMDKIQKYCS